MISVGSLFLSFGLAPLHGNRLHGTFSRRQEAFYYRNTCPIRLATFSVRVSVPHGPPLRSIRRNDPLGVVWEAFSLHAAL